MCRLVQYLDLRTTTAQNCEAVPMGARIQGSKTLYLSTLGSRVIKKKVVPETVRRLVQDLRTNMKVE